MADTPDTTVTTTAPPTPEVAPAVVENSWARRLAERQAGNYTSALESYAGAPTGSTEERRAERKLKRISQRHAPAETPEEPAVAPAAPPKQQKSKSRGLATLTTRQPTAQTYSFQQHLKTVPPETT